LELNQKKKIIIKKKAVPKIGPEFDREMLCPLVDWSE
jgi:hypothetical protein